MIEPVRRSSERIDIQLVRLGLAPSREKARAYLMAGMVLVNDVRVTKPGIRVPHNAPVRLKGIDHPYVSRGGIKLEAALERFGVSCQNKIALDVGASTGGFTDCLLNRGIKQVYAIDVGHGQLHEKLRRDHRVINLEKTNVKYLEKRHIPNMIDIMVADLSFISLTKCLLPCKMFLREEADCICLFKPQFEVGKDYVGKGGAVTNEAVALNALSRFVRIAEDARFRYLSHCSSPISGKKKKNTEYLVHFQNSEQ